MSKPIHVVSIERNSWGTPPWHVDFAPPKQPLPETADFAVIGAGFTGLAAAAWLRRLAPEKRVVVLERSRIGAGASGRTGGIVLSETAAGDLPGLGDVLASFQEVLRELEVDCDLSLPGAWEVARSEQADKSQHGHRWEGTSPISWQDSGRLRVISEVPGGTLDPGKQLGGLGRAAVRLGAIVVEHAEVRQIIWKESPELQLAEGRLRAAKVLLATNALSTDLTGLGSTIHPKLTLAARTAPFAEKQIESMGLSARKPFYTVDFPYLWGRLCTDRSVIWGAGLVDPPTESGDLTQVDVTQGQPARMFEALGARIRALHAVLVKANFTHFWGGPIAFRPNFEPVFSHHPASRSGIVLGVFAGHGVALSVHLGVWAAEALLERRELPAWGRFGGGQKTSRLW